MGSSCSSYTTFYRLDLRRMVMKRGRGCTGHYMARCSISKPRPLSPGCITDAQQQCESPRCFRPCLPPVPYITPPAQPRQPRSAARLPHPPNERRRHQKYPMNLTSLMLKLKQAHLRLKQEASQPPRDRCNSDSLLPACVQIARLHIVSPAHCPVTRPSTDTDLSACCECEQ